MDEAYIGSIVLFAGNFAPRGWMFCNGQILPIAQYSAVYAILGATYGGDGRTTFALPDLRGRIPVGVGTGTGLSPWDLGQKGGYENAQLPAHTHAASTSSLTLSATAAGNVTPKCCSEGGDKSVATGNCVASFSEGFVSPVDADANMAPIAVSLPVTGTVTGNVTIGPAGSNVALSNIQPSLGLNWIICMEGLFPSRN
jgi:microcystin-dependent protein